MLEQLDYIFFVYGLSFVLLGAQAWKISAQCTRGPRWGWLAAFGLLHGALEWLELIALSLGTTPVFDFLRGLLLVASFAALLEFARRSRRAQDRWAPPWWAGLGLTLIALSGRLAGPEGMDVAGRYALGIPSGLLAGWVLWQARSRRLTATPCWPLGMAGAALMLYAVAAGVIVHAASFPPASWLNQDVFFAATGIPIQLVRAAVALVAVVGIAGCRATDRASRSAAGYRREFIAVAAVLLVIGGWAATNWRGHKADRRMREVILRQATEIAETISPDQVRLLSFTEADRDNPSFARLREQLILFGQAIRQRSIYSLAIRGPDIVFGPENLDPADPWASSPGTVYQQPTARDWEALRTGVPYTEGPCTDEYGTFVSAFASVRDHRTDEVLMLIGLDIMAEDWKTQIARARFVPIVFTLLLLVLVLGGDAVLEWRERVGGEHGITRYAEPMLTAICGLVLTIAGTLLAHEEETASRQLIFDQLADNDATSLGRVFRELRDLQLAALARFYESSESVSRNEFRRYAGPLGRDAAIRAFEWIPRVPAAEKAKLEAQARAEGVHDFEVHQKGPRGENVSATGREEFYPVCFVEPMAGNEAVLGFDVGSEPVRRAALDAAARAGLPVATDPVTLIQQPEAAKGMLVFQPVFDGDTDPDVDSEGRAPTQRIRGFVLAVLHLQSVLEKAMSDGDAHRPITYVDLYQLRANQMPERLAAWPASRLDAAADFGLNLDSRLSTVFPLFMCGQCYAAVVHPGPAFLAAHPGRAAGQVGLLGLVLSTVVAGVMGFAVRRRVELEQEVLRRTVELEGVRTATETVQREEMRARALLEMSQLTINRSVNEVTDYALEVGIRLTGSKIGYIAFVNEAETVLTMAYWSKSAMAECAVIDKPIVYPVEKTGLWGEALRQRIPVITNDYEAPNPLKKGIPEGHVRVQRHMNIPVFDGDRIVAVAGVGNKETDYNEDDVLQLTLLMDGMWRIMCRKRAEQALRDSEERHRVLYESSSDAMMTVGPPSWRFTAMNPAGVRLFGAESEAQLLTMTPGDVSPERQPDGSLSAHKAAEMMGIAMAAGSHFFEWRHRRLNGEEFAAAVLLTRMHLEDQVFLHATVRDISAHQRAEALEQEQRSLKQAVTSMEHVLGVVGHELRTPLAGVRAMSEFLLLPDAQQSAEFNTFLKSINTEVVRMAEMVNDILEAARLSSGTARWNWSVFRLSEACQDAIDTIRPLMGTAPVELVLDVDPADVSMRGDRAAIWRLVTNLLRNAQKHTARGSITVRARFSCDQDGAWVNLCVQDTGAGMSPQVAQKLGEAFALNSGVVGDQCVKGSGLGLAICRGIAGAHGGSMEVHSTLGEGTAVIVRLRADLEEPLVDREPIQIVRNIHS